MTEKESLFSCRPNVRIGGDTDRVKARDHLIALADETSNPAAMRAVVWAWFYAGLSDESYEYEQDELEKALDVRG